MNKDILIKYLNNHCTDTEFDEFAEWIKLEAQKSKNQKWSFDYWKVFEHKLKKDDQKRYDALLDKIHHQINLKQNKTNGSKIIKLLRITKWIGRAAAILILPLIGIVFYILSTHNIKFNQYANVEVDSIEVIAPIGSKTVVQLSDGTKVNLNYGSSIKYPRNFTGENREIILSGEGYFDVFHNPDKPFVVKTGKLNIKAVGTEFNVCAYPGDNILSTALVQGKVIVKKILPDNTVLAVKKMTPGQLLSYDLSTEKFTLQTVNVGKYVAWKDGKLVFDNEPMTEIVKKLDRMFNVDIELAEDVKQFTYTVTFLNDPLYLILDLMTETTPITYEILPRKTQPDGTLSKQKIRIEKRK